MRKIPSSKYRIREGFPQHLKVILASFLSGSPLHGVTLHLLIRVCVIMEMGKCRETRKGALY